MLEYKCDVKSYILNPCFDRVSEPIIDGKKILVYREGKRKEEKEKEWMKKGKEGKENEERKGGKGSFAIALGWKGPRAI